VIINRLTFVVVHLTDGKRNVDHFTFILTQAVTLQRHSIASEQHKTGNERLIT